MNAQMRLVIMLASVAVSGSLLFAAEERPASTAQPTANADPAKTDAAKPEQPKAEAPAAEKAPADETADAKAEEAAPEATAKPDPAAAGDEDPGPPPAAANAKGGASPQRFTPSEQVRADFDVSFPIDI